MAQRNLVRRSCQPLLTRAGLSYKNFHMLRHACAFLSLDDGATLQKVSALLGYKSIGITGDLYGHLVKSDTSETSELMGRLFGKTDRPNDGIERCS